MFLYCLSSAAAAAAAAAAATAAVHLLFSSSIEFAWEEEVRTKQVKCSVNVFFLSFYL